MSAPPNADQSDAYAMDQLLPEPLPACPLELCDSWINEAVEREVQPNPTAMALATIDPDGSPSVRMVLCRRRNLAPDAGYLVFFTNYAGRKAIAVDANPHAAAVFHWDALERQLRVEGPVVRSSPEESDAYFATRPLEARIGAWASDQSSPLESRDDLLEKVAEVITRFGVTLDDPEGAVIPRPEGWGGYRLWASAVELWVGGPGRIHDRARWERKLTPAPGDAFTAGPWTSTRLQP